MPVTRHPSRYNQLLTVTTPRGDCVNVMSNLFVGASTFLSDEVFTAFRDADEDGVFSADMPSDLVDHFTNRGYLWPDSDSEEAIVAGLSTTYGGRDELAAGLSGGQYGFITSLNCNLACPYCFQREKADSVGYLDERQVDLGLAAIARCEERVAEIADGPTIPKVSITGGEPLLPSKANVQVLDYLVARLVELEWPFNITTNGTELERFVARHPATDQCKNVQVTLDGPRDVHDLRRAFRGGQPSFDKIAGGTDAALAAGWKITLRVNLDVTNVKDLPELADFVRDRGWPEHDTFSAYVSPVTDHGSLAPDGSVADEADLLALLLDLVEVEPGIRDVFDIRHFRGFNYVEQMLIHETPRYPVIYRCEAITGMYIFDPAGDIYVCLESVGEPFRRVGRYDPEFAIDEEAAARWSDRSVLSIPACESCKVRFVCAGGCAIEAFNRGDGAACMPFEREMELAWHHFARTRPELFVAP